MTPNTSSTDWVGLPANFSLFFSSPSLLPISFSIAPVFVVFFLYAVAIAKTTQVSFNFKFILQNVGLAQMIQWISVTLLFLWYPQVYQLASEEGALSTDVLQKVCTNLIAFFEAAILNFLATVAIFSIEVCSAMKTQWHASSTYACTMIGSCIIWLVFLFTNMLLSDDNIGEAREDGFCAVNHSNPDLWRSQAAIVSQLVVWVFTAIVCVAITACRVSEGGNQNQNQNQNQRRGISSMKTLVKTLLALCMVAFTNSLLNILPGYSLLVDIDAAPGVHTGVALVMMKQVVPVFTSAPGIMASLLIVMFMSYCNTRRERRRVIFVTIKRTVTIGGGERAEMDAADRDGAEKAEKMDAGGDEVEEAEKMDAGGDEVEEADKMDQDSK